MGVVRIQRAGFLTFAPREENPGNPEALLKARAALAAEGYSGQMSVKAKSKARRYVSNWLTALSARAGNAWADTSIAGQKITFVTLTLPGLQVHTDHELKRLALRPYLQELKRKFGADNYLWRAEPQKNGNVHFHILFDRFIPAYQVRKLWNVALARLGYINTYAHNQAAWHCNGFRVRRDLLAWWPEKRQREAYEYGQRTAWQNPNTTDIHALRKVKNVVAYVVKYVSKENQGRKIEGRVWECSETVRGLESCEMELDSRFDCMLKMLVKEKQCEMLQGDGFTFYRCDSRKVLETYYDSAGLLFVTHWQEQSDKLPVYCTKVVHTNKPPD